VLREDGSFTECEDVKTWGLEEHRGCLFEISDACVWRVNRIDEAKKQVLVSWMMPEELNVVEPSCPCNDSWVTYDTLRLDFCKSQKEYDDLMEAS